MDNLSRTYLTSTIDEQIANLKSRNLLIDDEDYARKVLSRISYYRLVKAYQSTLITGPKRNFKRKITFEHIVKLYEFDDELRQLLVPLLEKIEITLRCRIANHFGNKYGSCNYWQEENFNSDNFDTLKIQMELNIDIAKDSSPIISHFEKNGNREIPLYAAIEVFTFGTLALFYKSLKTEDQKEIAKMYYNGDNEYLKSWFTSVSSLRNKCAHFERLYHTNINKLPKLFKEDFMYSENNRLFRVLLCMRYLCHEYDGEWPSVVDSMKSLLEEYEGFIKPSAIGFSDGWDTKLLDQESYASLLFRKYSKS